MANFSDAVADPDNELLRLRQEADLKDARFEREEALRYQTAQELLAERTQKEKFRRKAAKSEAVLEDIRAEYERLERVHAGHGLQGELEPLARLLGILPPTPTPPDSPRTIASRRDRARRELRARTNMAMMQGLLFPGQLWLDAEVPSPQSVLGFASANASDSSDA